MDSLKFPNKDKAAKISIGFAIFVAVALITFVVFTSSLDSTAEENIRSELKEEINKSPEICDGFATIEQCLDNLMEAVLDS